MIKFRVFEKQDTVEEFRECYKPKNHRKVVLGQLLRGALSRIPKSLHGYYDPFYRDMPKPVCHKKLYYFVAKRTRSRMIKFVVANRRWLNESKFND